MLTVFHDITSPASAVAVARLQRLADEGLPVAFEGVETVGIDLRLPVTADVLAELEAVEDDATAEGITLRPPPVLPPTGLVHVLSEVAERLSLGRAWRTTAYGAFWSDAVDLADRAALTNLATAAGVDREQVRAALDDRRALAAVRRRRAQLRSEGVGGVPTILVHRTLVPGLLPETDLRAMVIG